MTADDDRHALQRFVAGLPVGADELATAVTAQALDRAIVEEALMRGLASEDEAVRRRTARRIPRMIDVGDRVAARLAVLAETDPDERTREAATAALRAHDRLPDVVAEPGRPRPRLLAALRFKLATVRSTGATIYEPAEQPVGARITDARLVVVDTVVHLRLQELPGEFEGTLPVVVAIDDAGGETELARAAVPVSSAGTVDIALPPEAGSLELLAARLRAFNLLVLER